MASPVFRFIGTIVSCVYFMRMHGLPCPILCNKHREKWKISFAALPKSYNIELSPLFPPAIYQLDNARGSVFPLATDTDEDFPSKIN